VLVAAPAEAIKTVNYNVLGPTPTPSAQELVDAVKAKIPAAALSFEINEDFQKLLDTNIVKPFDDSRARSEWGWKSGLDLDAIVEDFIANKT
jgi:nucleoside-diphosphate-sugar epimerase